VIETGDTEEVDALVVLDEQDTLVGDTGAPEATDLIPARSVAPAVQAAAVAATSFVAGAAVVGLARRRHHRRVLAKSRSSRRLGARGAGELLQIVGSRSLLVDVHLLGGSGGER
jgi:hypothetical protein